MGERKGKGESEEGGRQEEEEEEEEEENDDEDDEKREGGPGGWFLHFSGPPPFRQTNQQETTNRPSRSLPTLSHTTFPINPPSTRSLSTRGRKGEMGRQDVAERGKRRRSRSFPLRAETATSCWWRWCCLSCTVVGSGAAVAPLNNPLSLSLSHYPSFYTPFQPCSFFFYPAFLFPSSLLKT